MGKLIDADKLKEQILDIYVLEDGGRSGKTIAALYGALMRSKILEIIDRQPEVKAPFRAVAEIKVDEDKLKETCKEQIEEMMKKCPTMPLQPDPEVEFDGWIPVKNKYPVDNTDVLVTTIWGDMNVAQNEGGYWDSACGIYEPDEIVAWRPLPEPYMRDEKP